MCMPKAPKEDPEVKRSQERMRQAEMDRLAEEKKKATIAERRGLRVGTGTRSLLSPGNPGSGFGRLS